MNYAQAVAVYYDFCARMDAKKPLLKQGGKRPGKKCGKGYIAAERKCKAESHATETKKLNEKGEEYTSRRMTAAGKASAQELAAKVRARKGLKPIDKSVLTPDNKDKKTGVKNMLTKEMVNAEPWKYTASQYQAVHGVKQPWIAEISPMQMGMMSKRQKAEYEKKRSEEWDASAKIKDEWADKVYAAYKSGKITDKDLEAAPKSKGLFGPMSASEVVFHRKQAEEKAGRDKLVKEASQKNQIQSADDVEVGDRVYDIFSRGYVTVEKKFKNKLRVTYANGDSSNLQLGAAKWRSHDDLEKVALNGESVRPPKPEMPKAGSTEVKAKKEKTSRPKVTDVDHNGFYKTDLLKEARELAKKTGRYSPTTDRLFEAQNRLNKLGEGHKIVAIGKGKDREYAIVYDNKQDSDYDFPFSDWSLYLDSLAASC